LSESAYGHVWRDARAKGPTPLRRRRSRRRPSAALAAEAAPYLAGPSGGWSGITLAGNVDSREEVDTAFAAAVKAGATVAAEPTDRPWGGRSAYIADPEGNRWEIAWARTAVFDERGALISFG
jgi:hypothetical protein